MEHTKCLGNICRYLVSTAITVESVRILGLEKLSLGQSFNLPGIAKTDADNRKRRNSSLFYQLVSEWPFCHLTLSLGVQLILHFPAYHCMARTKFVPIFLSDRTLFISSITTRGICGNNVKTESTRSKLSEFAVSKTLSDSHSYAVSSTPTVPRIAIYIFPVENSMKSPPSGSKEIVISDLSRGQIALIN